MCKVGFKTKLYRSVSFINLFTFVTCRLIPQVRLYAGFYYDFYRITTTYFMFFTLTVSTGVVINIILFWRLVKTDILKPYIHFSLLSPTSPCEFSEREVISPSNLKVVRALWQTDSYKYSKLPWSILNVCW
jgi:hypothetical protein